MRFLINSAGIIGILCLVHFIFLLIQGGIESAFLWFWLAAGAGCLVGMGILRFIYDHKIVVPNIVRIGFVGGLVAAVSIFLILEIMIISHGFQKPSKDADYVIVLGAQVRGTVLTKSLTKRLDQSIAYLQTNNKTKVIVSGGQGNGEDISEASAMENYLIQKGIKSERIIKEDRSTNTHENILFSSYLLDKKKKVVIVSNQFHLFRAIRIAKSQGFQQVEGLGASTDVGLRFNAYIREGFAVLKDLVVGNLRLW